MKGNYYLQSYYHFTYDNNIKNFIQPAGTDNLPDKSYYLTSKPYFWNVNSDWPSVGGNNILGSGTIPAKERYLSGNNITVCLKPASMPLRINIAIDSIKCNGGTAHIVVSATGGQPPYTGTGAFDEAAGSYHFTVTDAFDYSEVATVILMQPAVVNVTVNTTAAGSCTQTGSIALHATGGVRPYYYSLDGNRFTADSVFNNLAGGNYNVWVQDNNHCTDTLQNIIVATTPTIIIKAKTTSAASCADDGTITVTRNSGGVGPFKYSLNNINYYNNNIFSNLAPGIYTAWIKDKNGCKDSLTNIKVTRVAELVATATKTNLTCRNKNDGTITIKAKGGVSPYLYSLDSVNYISTNVFTNLHPGSYIARIKDAKNCTAFVNVIISNSKTNCPANFAADTGFLNVTVAPNPSTKNFVLSIKNKDDEPIEFIVSDVIGRKLIDVRGVSSETYSFGENLAAGVYIIKFFQGINSKSYKIIKR